MGVTLIVAAAQNDVIGIGGRLPWRLTADLRRFAQLTRGHAVVMGRVTYESIVARLGHPLADRHSIVVSRSLRDVPAGVEVVASPQDAAERAEAYGSEHGVPDWFVIGGARLYADLLDTVDTVLLTRVHAIVDGDRAMPARWLDGFRVVSTEPGPDDGTGLPYSFVRLERA